MAEIDLTLDTFDEEVLESEIPVLVDFWASWCGPCQMTAPVLADIAEEYDAKIKVCKVNTDEEPALCQRFGIMSIPTLMAFKDGQMIKKTVGFHSKEEILKLFD